MLAVDVVPTVAMTANGLIPRPRNATSCATISRSTLGSIQNCASVGTRCTFSAAKIPKKHQITPVHHPRNDDLIDIAKNLLERLGVFRRVSRKRSENRARFVVRCNPQRS